MKRILKKIVRLFIVFVVASSSIGVFATTDWDRTQIMKELEKEQASSKVEANEVLEGNEQEEEEKEEEQIAQSEEIVSEETSQNNAQPAESTPVNKIEIPNVLQKSLMKDYDGSHFYLNHNIYGNYDGIGVPFVDYRTNFYGRKTIIYAHSSTAGNGPFQALQNYHNNPGYFQNHRYINVTFNGVNYTYEIFSVYVALATDEYSPSLEYFYGMNYSDYEWQQTLEQYKRNSEYETGVSVNSGDKVLILQTCSMDPAHYGNYLYYNLLVMAKLV